MQDMDIRELFLMIGEREVRIKLLEAEVERVKKQLEFVSQMNTELTSKLTGKANG